MSNSEPRQEAYFVASEGEAPHQIHFTKQDAFNSQALYLDSFDSQGIKVQEYKLVDGKYASSGY